MTAPGSGTRTFPCATMCHFSRSCATKTEPTFGARPSARTNVRAQQPRKWHKSGTRKNDVLPPKTAKYQPLTLVSGTSGTHFSHNKKCKELKEEVKESVICGLCKKTVPLAPHNRSAT